MIDYKSLLVTFVSMIIVSLIVSGGTAIALYSVQRTNMDKLEKVNAQLAEVQLVQGAAMEHIIDGVNNISATINANAKITNELTQDIDALTHSVANVSRSSEDVASTAQYPMNITVILKDSKRATSLPQYYIPLRDRQINNLSSPDDVWQSSCYDIIDGNITTHVCMY